MGVNLTKGQRVNLTKDNPNLKTALIGLGWDARATAGAQFDLDLYIFLCNEQGKVISDKHFVFWGNLAFPNEQAPVLKHTGDNRDGGGEGDDESCELTMSKLPADVSRVVFAVVIDEAEKRGQSFGQVSNAFIRVVDKDTGKELYKYDLSDDYSTEKAMIFGEIYRDKTDATQMKFTAVGQGFAGGKVELAKQYGVDAFAS